MKTPDDEPEVMGTWTVLKTTAPASALLAAVARNADTKGEVIIMGRQHFDNYCMLIRLGALR